MSWRYLCGGLVWCIIGKSWEKRGRGKRVGAKDERDFPTLGLERNYIYGRGLRAMGAGKRGLGGRSRM